MPSAEVRNRLHDEQGLRPELREATMTPHRELWTLRAELDELEAVTIRRELLNGIKPDQQIRARLSRLKYLIRELEKHGA